MSKSRHMNKRKASKRAIGRKPKRRRIEETPVLPNGWLVQNDKGIMKYYRIESSRADPPTHKLTHIVMEGIDSLHVEVLGKHLSKATTPALDVLTGLPTRTSTVKKVTLINNLTVCKGNPDPPMLTLADKHGKMYDIWRNVVAVIQDQTIRHSNCEILVHSGIRCHPCKKYRRTLAMKLTRQRQSRSKGLHSENTRLSVMNTPQKLERVKYHQRRSRALMMQKARLESKLAQLQEESTVDAEEELSSELMTILTKEDCNIRKLPGNNIKRLFWEQQRKASQLRGPSGMRWHPLMIKWCLYIKSMSTSAYETLRDVLQLPSTRTLRDYTHWMTAEPGIHTEVLEDLEDKADNLESKYVVLTLDEMKIKEDLVYKKQTNEVIGFVNLGDTVKQLQELESCNTKRKIKDVATHVLQFMVRALVGKLDYPLAHFSTSALSGEQLFSLTWEAIEAVETAGLKVIVITADGASQNRKLFRLHEDPSGSNMSNGVVYKTSNILAPERDIYFMSDVPHLLKTTRNCWEKSRNGGTRLMQKGGKFIVWQHLLDIYNKTQSDSGLFIGKKLKREHVHLTPFSRMRVDLAAQVLSLSVAKAMEFYTINTGNTDTQATQQFVRFMDCFFDCFNVRNIKEGKKTRKAARDPYRSMDDWRFTWLKEIFLKYLHDWETEVKSKAGYTALQKAKMILSHETLYGIRMTVLAFLEVGPLLLADNSIKFLLTERFSQDSLESFFGDQRSRGHRNMNPNVQQYSINANILRVSGGLLRAERGNTRGREKDATQETAKLQKRQQTRV